MLLSATKIKKKKKDTENVSLALTKSLPSLDQIETMASGSCGWQIFEAHCGLVCPCIPGRQVSHKIEVSMEKGGFCPRPQHNLLFLCWPDSENSQFPAHPPKCVTHVVCSQHSVLPRFQRREHNFLWCVSASGTCPEYRPAHSPDHRECSDAQLHHFLELCNFRWLWASVSSCGKWGW